MSDAPAKPNAVLLAAVLGAECKNWGRDIFIQCRTARGNDVFLGMRHPLAMELVITFLQAIQQSTTLRRQQAEQSPRPTTDVPPVYWPVQATDARALPPLNRVGLFLQIQPGEGLPLTLTASQARALAASLLHQADALDADPHARMH